MSESQHGRYRGENWTLNITHCPADRYGHLEGEVIVHIDEDCSAGGRSWVIPLDTFRNMLCEAGFIEDTHEAEVEHEAETRQEVEGMTVPKSSIYENQGRRLCFNTISVANGDDLVFVYAGLVYAGLAGQDNGVVVEKGKLIAMLQEAGIIEDTPDSVPEPAQPPFHLFTGAICKGCYAFGTACGACEKCRWEQKQLSADSRHPEQKDVDLAKTFLLTHLSCLHGTAPLYLIHAEWRDYSVRAGNDILATARDQLDITEEIVRGETCWSLPEHVYQEFISRREQQEQLLDRLLVRSEPWET